MHKESLKKLSRHAEKSYHSSKRFQVLEKTAYKIGPWLVSEQLEFKETFTILYQEQWIVSKVFE